MKPMHVATIGGVLMFLGLFTLSEIFGIGLLVLVAPAVLALRKGWRDA